MTSKYQVCTDYKATSHRYVITEEHRDGYFVLARFNRLADAKMENMKAQWN